jgi:SAM-dependent methyltransferase
MPEGWEWDESLYLGSAPYYAQGRPPYAPGLPDQLADALGLDGRGRLIDVGCGPGILTLTLAHLFTEAVGVDPDPGMLTESARRATEAGIVNVRWVQSRAEDLAADLGPFRVATFGQSFHWMDRARVAAIAYDMLDLGGAFVHVSDVKESSAARSEQLPHPEPPYAAIRQLVGWYLGDVRRAGKGWLRQGTPDNEAAVLSAAGFEGPTCLRVPAAGVLVRSVADIVAWTYSLSSSAPHLFGYDLRAFESDLRQLLGDASPSGQFAERPPDTEVVIWRTSRRMGTDTGDVKRELNE